MNMLLLLLALTGYEPAIGYFEGYEETCSGWDGIDELLEAEQKGVCRYFELTQ